MSKRLQVLLDEAEYRALQRLARRQKTTVSEWVRQAIRSMRRQQPLDTAGRKLGVVRAAERHQFPTADIEEMLTQVERGYLSDTGR